MGAKTKITSSSAAGIKKPIVTTSTPQPAQKKALIGGSSVKGSAVTNKVSINPHTDSLND